MSYRLLRLSLFALLLSTSSLVRAEMTILILGDSLTEGYGLEPEQAYPQLVEQRFHAAGREDIQVINGGVSGATSASGPSRLRWYLRAQPELMLLALGANDGLRGLSVEQLRDNLVETIELALANDLRVALAGMMIPPNYGAEYSEDFAALYPALAEEYDLPFLPFLLEGVAAVPELNLADGIHPNAEGNRIIAEQVHAFLLTLLPES